MGSSNCSLRRQQHTEVAALWLYGCAIDDGIAITRHWCEQRIREVRAHALTCRCTAPHEAARGASTSGAYWIAVTWQRAERKAKVLARR